MTASERSRHFVIVGAGIVGLSAARAVQIARPGSTVTILEKEQRASQHQTGRNSGVLHSGIYYRPGSLKARLCAEGRVEMIAYARSKGIAHEITGKLIVATRPDELQRLRALEERGIGHGLTVRRIDRAEISSYEPHVDAVAALHVAETGIIDYVGVGEALKGDIEDAGGAIEFGTRVRDVSQTGASVRVETDATTYRADCLINCAGLQADLVAGLSGRHAPARIIPFRGEYFELRPERNSLVRGLIYPVPDPDLPFLGVHLTRMVGGQVHCGPNAVLALAREGYRWSDVDAREIARQVSYPGTWKLARNHLRTGISEVHRSLSRPKFVRSLQRLVPDIRKDDLVRSPAGVRAQAVARDGSLLDDFEIIRDGRIVNVINAPSPAATSSLVIGRHIESMIERDI